MEYYTSVLEVKYSNNSVGFVPNDSDLHFIFCGLFTHSGLSLFQTQLPSRKNSRSSRSHPLPPLRPPSLPLCSPPYNLHLHLNPSGRNRIQR